MKFSFHEVAEDELISAIEYYESCQPGLGFRFSEEVDSSSVQIPFGMGVD